MNGSGNVIGSYASLGFPAERKDVDWTLAETAESTSRVYRIQVWHKTQVSQVEKFSAV